MDLRPRFVVSAKMNDTLEQVIQKLVEHKIHRLYVIDDDHKPVGVISLKDILMEIITGTN